MNEPLDLRTHNFACSIGIPYQLASIVTKRIPQKTSTTIANGTKKVKNNDRKVFSILMKLYDDKKKYIFNYNYNLPQTEKYIFLKSYINKEILLTLSQNEINELYIRYKLKEVIGTYFPSEIDILTLDKSEIDILVNWFF